MESERYSRFSLTLMVTHRCNLRCGYCYVGEKSNRVMDVRVGMRAIDRAAASLEDGGALELGFFGGEPLLEADLVGLLAHYARETCRERRLGLSMGLTTNGTIRTPGAWRLMTSPDIRLAVSHDGLPVVHDRNRRGVCGKGSSREVGRTIERLIESGVSFDIVVVVTPDTVGYLPAGIQYLRRQGVRRFVPSVDIWSGWGRSASRRLRASVARCGAIWSDGLPDIAMSWFDEKLALMAGTDITDTARCGFGSGEIAVAPSGRLYPCERLIGEDREGNPMRLPGSVDEGDDFTTIRRSPCRDCRGCSECAIAGLCNTTCRCSNYVRTGDVRRPDGLLCLLNHLCVEVVTEMLCDREKQKKLRERLSVRSGKEGVCAFGGVRG